MMIIEVHSEEPWFTADRLAPALLATDLLARLLAHWVQPDKAARYVVKAVTRSTTSNRARGYADVGRPN